VWIAAAAPRLVNAADAVVAPVPPWEIEAVPVICENEGVAPFTTVHVLVAVQR